VPRTGDHYLPRLPREHYQGDAVVHWTLTTFDRAALRLDAVLHLRFRELLLHAQIREGLLCPTYCLMPDHLHLVWMGLRRDSDQLNGMAFLRTHLEPLLAPVRFQPQAHDHVLGGEERRRNAFARTCGYVLQNPLRAGLVTRLEDWAYCGCVVPGCPKLHPREEGFWEKFWRLYLKQREPDAGDLKRPPRS
jgi:REP element-mobilizing transposase RayT